MDIFKVYTDVEVESQKVEAETTVWTDEGQDSANLTLHTPEYVIEDFEVVVTSADLQDLSRNQLRSLCEVLFETYPNTMQQLIDSEGWVKFGGKS